jgi:excisionase family DNA binding protein
MKISNTISQAIIAATTGILQPFVSDLTPTKLIAALKAYDADSTSKLELRPQRPYTVAEAMTLLSASKPTIYRLFADKVLTKIKIRGLTRIPAAEIEALMTGGVKLDKRAEP